MGSFTVLGGRYRNSSLAAANNCPVAKRSFNAANVSVSQFTATSLLLQLQKREAVLQQQQNKLCSNKTAGLLFRLLQICYKSSSFAQV